MADNALIELLEQNGPMLSSDLSKLLETQYGLSPEAARKRVERGCQGINRLSHVIFPHRARFVYRQDDYGSPYFFDNLMETLKKTRSTYFAAFQALGLRGNVMPRAHFLIACGAPVSQKKHVSAESLLERLVKATLVKEVTLPGGEDCVVRSDHHQKLDLPFMWAKMKGRLIAEKITLLAVKEWSRNLGMVSFNAVETREDEGSEDLPKVGTFNWDLAGPSYLFPMREYTNAKIKPGFLVCDLALNGRVNADQLAGFVNKCVTLRSLRKVGKCLQIFVAESYDNQAFALLKEKGIIPATTDSLFGRDVASALKNLCTALSNTAKLAQDPDALDKIFNDLSRIEGAASTLRGSLFEFAVAQIGRSTFLGYSQEMNRIVRDSIGAEAEIDVLAHRASHEVVFIECKGIHPISTLDDGEVEKWLDKRIPVIRGFAKSHSDWASITQRFELWTSGKFSEEAIAMVKARQAVTAKFDIQLRDADYVLAQAVASKDTGLLKTYQQHFVTHPMQEIEEAKKREQRKAEKAADKLKKPIVVAPQPPPVSPPALGQTDSINP
ncbi:hypothetical protein C4K06_6160 [Pseudomonas chlororaphis subsp. aureofaciens]|uniref:AsnC family protein n=1 Tax=Pseudomonas chlororaphis TaxID=587753 RepID=UPI000F58E782|nr:AsnC family protein [Pseudomonas chlororaphis]AZE39148.1 hypothetical protein C4K06_6160 [Pseudomonas chlororaphis subsp. aureofaciens]